MLLDRALKSPIVLVVYAFNSKLPGIFLVNLHLRVCFAHLHNVIITISKNGNEYLSWLYDQALKSPMGFLMYVVKKTFYDFFR